MARKWQLRTWTKGTGATVEPVGSGDALEGRARPGGLTPLPPRRPWSERSRRRQSVPQEHVTTGAARRRHALRHMDEAVVAKLEKLEAELAGTREEVTR